MLPTYEICEKNNFFKKNQFHFHVFARRASFPFKQAKAIFQQSRKLKSQNFYKP